MMKLRLIYLLLLVSFTAMAVENVVTADMSTIALSKEKEQKNNRTINIYK